MKRIFFALLFLGACYSCTKDVTEDLDDDSNDTGTEDVSGGGDAGVSNAVVSEFWKSRWKRSDVDNGTFLDLSNSTAEFCSQSDWSKFVYSETVELSASFVQFTITNPATGAYITLDFERITGDAILGTVYETNMPEWREGASYGYYVRTTDWCDNNSSNGSGSNSNNGSGSSSASGLTLEINGVQYTVSGQDNATGATVNEAVSVCQKSTEGGNNDWYLPSAKEMAAIYKLHKETEILSEARYWTSSVSNDGYNYPVYFSVAKETAYDGWDIDAEYNCRCIRNSNYDSNSGSGTGGSSAVNVTGKTGTLEDYDGNSYKWIGIGKQVWMAQDLRVTHFPNGTEIQNVEDGAQWANLEDDDYSDAYCITEESAVLYTYSAAIADNWENCNKAGQGICPDGWHIPSNDEWTVLIDFLSENGYAWDGKIGSKKVAKALASKTGWKFDNLNCNEGDVGKDPNLNNSSRFNAKSQGGRSSTDGDFYSIGKDVGWWTSTEAGTATAYEHSLGSWGSGVSNWDADKSNGLSVRCLRD